MKAGDFAAQSPDRDALTAHGASAPPREKTALSRIRLRHLTCFVVVAQERTLARAAARLHLSQPAVSKTLAELGDLAGRRRRAHWGGGADRPGDPGGRAANRGRGAAR